jgi:hypothetical protein
MQVLESNDKDHAHGNVKRHGIDASKEAMGDDSNVICLHAPHGVAQGASHSQLASQGTRVVNVHNADMAMYWLSTSISSVVVSGAVFVFCTFPCCNHTQQR